MTQPYFERVLLVLGDPNTGKSVQLRSMFQHPRLGGTIPTSRNIVTTYPLSQGRSLYLRLTSPHEMGESLQDFFNKIFAKATSGRWCVAVPIQISATATMPDPPSVVSAIETQLAPERIRVCILSPDYNGNVLPTLMQLTDSLWQTPSCEVLTIDARDRQRNGFLLADTFDFG